MLDGFCQQHNLTHAEAFRVAIDLLKKDLFAKRVKAQFEALARNPNALREYHEESELWDTSASDDGIDFEEGQPLIEL